MTDAQLSFEREPLAGQRGERWTLARAGKPLSSAQVLAAWRDDPSFCDTFSARLAACEYAAYLFETPPLRADTITRAFEYVLIDAPALAARRADPRPFAEQLAGAELVACFTNLGGDAKLVAPTPGADGCDYTHLASFSRSAPRQQQRALWAATAQAMLGALGDAPRWLSSSGLGVSWLHLRIDRRPKYVAHPPYRRS